MTENILSNLTRGRFSAGHYELANHHFDQTGRHLIIALLIILVVQTAISTCTIDFLTDIHPA